MLVFPNMEKYVGNEFDCHARRQEVNVNSNPMQGKVHPGFETQRRMSPTQNRSIGDAPKRKRSPKCLF